MNSPAEGGIRKYIVRNENLHFILYSRHLSLRTKGAVTDKRLQQDEVLARGKGRKANRRILKWRRRGFKYSRSRI